MKVMNKSDAVSEFNDAIGAYGYNYGGLTIVDKGKENETQYAYWVKNCQHIESTTRVEWERGIDRSFIILIYKPSNKIPRWFEYTFQSKSSYKTFVSTAKQNGFKFISDGIEESYIYSTFERINNAKKYKEKMRFFEHPDPSYTVMYWRENL